MDIRNIRTKEAQAISKEYVDQMIKDSKCIKCEIWAWVCSSCIFGAIVYAVFYI